ncbi:MAG: hypothetical protein GXP16_13640 [Gammaproteobacteria bacterium]|nr:hypothetical protein [Gammaproteobacteria bacterium]
MIKRFLQTSVIFLVVILGVTVVALESSGVVQVETKTKENNHRQTHVWFVQTSEGISLEAGNPSNPWVQDLEEAQVLRLSGETLDGLYRFTRDKSDTGRKAIRKLMREKYGWRDKWISLLFDGSQSTWLKLIRVD